eukprot:COSAG05_NODE_359_length_10803_cov_14.909193_2_plen_78_part_00
MPRAKSGIGEVPEQAPSAGVLGQFVECECADAIGISSAGGVGSKLSAVARCLRENSCVPGRGSFWAAVAIRGERYSD